MKQNYEFVYRMKLTGYQVRTAIGILNEIKPSLYRNFAVNEGGFFYCQN